MSTRKKRPKRSSAPLIFLILLMIGGASFGAWTYREPLGLVRPAKEAAQAEAAAPAADRIEACNASLAGSNTIGEHLAPAVVAAFLRYNQYEVGPPQMTKESEVRLVGVRDRWSCTVDIRSHGSGTAFEELVRDTALIGMSSRPIRAEEAAQIAGDDPTRAEHVVAMDGIAIITHPSNPLRQISMADIKRLFMGEITDWSALGAPFGAIRVYSRDDNSGTFQFFHEAVLAKDPRWDAFKASSRRFESSTALVAAVAADPQAIGFVGLAYVGPGVRALLVSDGGPAIAPTDANVRSEIYPISRRLFLYVRPATYETNNFVNALVNHFKSAEAYSIVQDLNYVSLRPIAAATGGPEEAEIACRAGSAEAEVYRASTLGAQRLSSVIRFLPGSNETDSLARDDIRRVMPAIKEALAEGAVVRLIGHSDDRGADERNRTLAMVRAEAIRREFEAQGVLGIAIESAGEMCPVASNASESGRESNRRVEIWIARNRA